MHIAFEKQQFLLEHLNEFESEVSKDWQGSEEVTTETSRPHSKKKTMLFQSLDGEKVRGCSRHPQARFSAFAKTMSKLVDKQSKGTARGQGSI